MNKDIFNRLDCCYIEFDPSWDHETEIINARLLLTSLRFDLYAILQYIDQIVNGVSDLTYAKEIYYQRTNIITGYTCSERGNDNKNSFDDFVTCLDNLISDFQENKFDVSKSIIPVDKNYVILDGAHRVCCAAYFNREIEIVRFTNKDFNLFVTCDFMINKGLPSYVADAMALEYCRWHKNIFMLFLWPKSFCLPEKYKEAYELIRANVNIVYHKQSKLSYNGIRNLMIQIYSHMPWIGNVDNDFQSTYIKANEVWDNNGNVEFILCEAPSCEYILSVKKKVRDIFKIGLASIHSTDNAKETKIAANLIFNPNSVHHLNFGYPDKFKDSYHLLESFKSQISSKQLDFSKFVIDSSMVMAIYGIRKAADLDYHTSYPETKSLCWEDEIEDHRASISYYHKTCSDLIYNPKNYFIFNELKFVTLRNVSMFKKNRMMNRDATDICLIKPYISNSRIKTFFFKVNISLLQNKIKSKILLRKKIDAVLLTLGIRPLVANLYHFIKRKK